MKRILLSVLTLAFAMTLSIGSTAVAQGTIPGQGDEVNPAVQVVVGIANLIALQLPEQDREAYQTGLEVGGENNTALATWIVQELDKFRYIGNSTRTLMTDAISSGNLHRDTIIVFLADLINGEVVVDPTTPRELESDLEALGIMIPSGDSEGFLTIEDAKSIVTSLAVGSPAFSAIRTNYIKAITPPFGE